MDTLRYFGGKAKMPWIADYLNDIRLSGQAYWEPFVGGGWVLSRIQNNGAQHYASDLFPELIAMWKAVQAGWLPPENVTPAEYEAARTGVGSLERRAFIGFGCSYGGQWVQGQAQHKDRNYAAEAKRSLERKAHTLPSPLRFDVADFLGYVPLEGCLLIYCDPPYKDAKEYRHLPEFDHAAFWEQVRQLEMSGHVVLVSEYQAPEDFYVVADGASVVSVDHRIKNERRIERLFRYKYG